MQVSVICPNLSGNCLGRAHLLTELLKINYDVEIIGPKFEDTIWKPLKNAHSYKVLNDSNSILSTTKLATKLKNKAKGNILLASKPMMTSFGVSLLSKLNIDRPIILDIDDWESRFHKHNSFIVTHLLSTLRLKNPNSYYWIRLLELISNKADKLTVSNSFLKKRFGGEIIPHVRDTSEFDPDNFDKLKERDEFEIPLDKTVVMFFGTPRPHKGVSDLIKAVEMTSSDIILVIVGAGDEKYTSKLKNRQNNRFLIYGKQPFDEIPKWLSTADIIAIPQRESSSAIGQLPAKLFDAMAMSKPIITTDVSMIPNVIGDCGVIIEPGNVNDLYNNIVRLNNNPELRYRLGRCARNRCEKKYSYNAVAPQLSHIIEQVR